MLNFLPHRHWHLHTHGERYLIANEHKHRHFHFKRHRHRHTYRDVDGDEHGHTDGNGDPYTYTDAYAHGAAEQDSDRDSHSRADFDRHTGSSDNDANAGAALHPPPRHWLRWPHLRGTVKSSAGGESMDAAALKEQGILEGKPREYFEDIAEAEQQVKQRRHSGYEGRVHFLLNEKMSWLLALAGVQLTIVKRIDEQTKGGGSDLGPLTDAVTKLGVDVAFLVEQERKRTGAFIAIEGPVTPR